MNNKTVYVNGYLNELIEKCKNAEEHYCILGLYMLMWPYASEYVMGNPQCYERGQKHILNIILHQALAIGRDSLKQRMLPRSF